MSKVDNKQVYTYNNLLILSELKTINKMFHY